MILHSTFISYKIFRSAGDFLFSPFVPPKNTISGLNLGEKENRSPCTCCTMSFLTCGPKLEALNSGEHTTLSSGHVTHAKEKERMIPFVRMLQLTLVYFVFNFTFPFIVFSS